MCIVCGCSCTNCANKGTDDEGNIIPCGCGCATVGHTGYWACGCTEDTAATDAGAAGQDSV